MPQDKYTAVWVSNSSMSDFVNCPRLYYLRNVYKDPATGHKINIINPALALGQTVHEVLEELAFVAAADRLKESLLEKYEVVWKKVSGKLGGFHDAYEEKQTKKRGQEMLQRVMENPGPIRNKSIKIRRHDRNYLPNYYLSLDENIILCGKLDWMEYLPDDDTVHIIDFKTGKHDEKKDSLQLPIYHLLVKNCQKRSVSKASYWYLDRNDEPSEITLPGIDDAYEQVLTLAKNVKEARLNRSYVCPKGGCFACEPFEKILTGKAEFVGTGGYSQDMYIIV
jgi:ATP-dependent helicase/DNAse subunit B